MSIFENFLSEKYNTFKYLTIIGALCLASCENATLENKTTTQPNSSEIDALPSISKGRAVDNVSRIFECDVPGWRVTAAGTISGQDNQNWTVPAETVFTSAPKATDLFNECNDVLMANENELNPNSIPLVELDKDGEVFVGYLFGDNYFEFFVNGEIIAVDPVPYWPFNTSAVRFKVKRPFVAGVKMIDWSENLGLGSETMRGVPFHTGDGGFVAVFKNADGDVISTTDNSWKVQPYYIAPLLDASCVAADRTSENCVVPPKPEAENAYGAHWKLPEDWGSKNFDDSHWQNATLYTNEDIGGSIQRPAYQNFTGLFDDPANDAEFIWSKNLLLDNVVLGRRVIE